MAALQSTLAAEQAQLARTQASLRAARARLVDLRGRLARDRRVLAAQLVARYEAPAPDLISVLFSSRGFADLLERVDDLRRITPAEHADHALRRPYQDGRARPDGALRAARVPAGAPDRCGADPARRGRPAQAGDRQPPGALHQLAVAQERPARGPARPCQGARAPARDRAGAGRRRAGAGVRHHRSGDACRRRSVRSRRTAARTASSRPRARTTASARSRCWPARLDALGKALHLHLVGLSGYRTPQHSVEVGGFADDPHTKGLASDTPGVEGVSEATLNSFGLTRPFGGAAEADHIQPIGTA